MSVVSGMSIDTLVSRAISRPTLTSIPSVTTPSGASSMLLEKKFMSI